MAGAGKMRTRSGGGQLARSGVTEMREGLESQITKLKEEKEDMMLKYHVTSSKLNEQKRCFAELNEEVEKSRLQLIELEVSPRCDRSGDVWFY